MGRTKGKHSEDMEKLTPEDPVQTTPPGDQTDKLDIILQEIRDSRQAIEKKLGSIMIELNILKDDQKKLSDRMKQTESNVAEILPTHKENKDAIEHLQQQVKALQERVEDAEGRYLHNNVYIIGLLEGKEGRNPTQ
ncbi:hypothetical protein NDU88_006106 [Pleurodeles waltl]|uniref:Uncharacterized protein n=1 Tax=Pleurodeles waltl TaxID=8319 RepID=A0AAV7SNM4_PLEWA|nr:hypothetical protein NDU88_006106 [Pleurodeles waltl]